MDTQQRYSGKTFAIEMIAIVLALLFLVPFYFVIVNSLKTFAELLTDPTSLPTVLQWNNFSRAWNIMKFPTVLTKY
jgi:raffinose/stachyose/melibiose transport system permease protein